MDSSRTPLRRLKPGDRPKASEWNAIVDQLSRVEIGSDRAIGPPPIPFNGTSVLVRNDTGAILAQYSPFRINKTSAEVFNPISAPGAFAANMPIAAATATDNKIFHSVGVTLEPIAIDGYGRAAISGVVPCIVQIAKVAHRYAKLRTDSLVKLDSCNYGPVEIIWNVGTTGELFSLVKLGTMPGVLFPVKVDQVGGSAGNATTQCSFTYTVQDLNEQELTTVATPLKRRPALGKMSAADGFGWGTGFYDIDGTFKLWDANETLSAEACA